ncbi:competence protein ComEC [Clavibacter sp. B3I6]|uniref:ComEC/Rec2 family competence protein n=1 Tax=Clavibacter sp. B3I6 TaxID=3042268 RepID=UPI002782EE60|nr:ComEC/Rec2 family competence protein [Clavibacter sp. B3I6]MDQ0743198.1 competence protein ComEC [Clavibacter sp. B3I6]
MNPPERIGRGSTSTPRRPPSSARQIDLRLALPAAVAWTATALAVGVRRVSAGLAVAAAVLALAGAGIAVGAAMPRSSAPRDVGVDVGSDAHPGGGSPRPARCARRSARAGVGPHATAPLLRAVAGGAVAAGATALLLGAAATQEPLRHPAALDAAASADGMVVADLILDEPPAPLASKAGGGSGGAGGRVRLVAHLTALHVGQDAHGRAADGTVVLAAPVPVVVFAGRPHDERDGRDGSPGGRLGVGTVVQLSAAVRQADPADRAAYLLLARGALEATAAPSGASGVADALRAGLARAAAALPGPGAELLPGLAIGDVSAVAPALAQSMKDSSLTHLTAVSGANCAVIVGLVLALTAALGLRRPARAAASLVALGAFVVLVTPQPSVRRAAVMATVLILSTASGRPSRGLPALSLAVLVLLAGDPWLARDLGFALSVLATAGLLVLAPPLADRLAHRMPRRLADALSIPVAAQVACQPVLLVLQPGLPVHGVLANLLAEPAAAPATIGGLAACVLLPVWPAAGGLVLRLAWLPAAWIAAVASVLSGLPWGRVPWPTGAGGVVALVVATALAVAAIALGRGPRPVPRPAALPATADVPPDG